MFVRPHVVATAPDTPLPPLPPLPPEGLEDVRSRGLGLGHGAQRRNRDHTVQWRGRTLDVKGGFVPASLPRCRTVLCPHFPLDGLGDVRSGGARVCTRAENICKTKRWGPRGAMAATPALHGQGLIPRGVAAAPGRPLLPLPRGVGGGLGVAGALTSCGCWSLR